MKLTATIALLVIQIPMMDSAVAQTNVDALVLNTRQHFEMADAKGR